MANDEEERPLSTDVTEAVAEIPDVAEPLLGFRSWIFDRKRQQLRSVVMGGNYWPPHRDQEAFCPKKDHPAAYPGCSCGVYAAYDIPAAAPYTGVGNVFGLVWGFGSGQRVVPADNGFRAGFGRIAAFFLIVPEVSLPAARLRRLADAYGVPLITPHSLVVEDYRPLITAGVTNVDEELRKLIDGA